MAMHKKSLPPWLLGLIVAVVIFGIGLLVFSALGYGDDPVLEPGTTGELIVTFEL